MTHAAQRFRPRGANSMRAMLVPRPNSMANTTKLGEASDTSALYCITLTKYGELSSNRLIRCSI
jgi:hypothetical protein